MYPPRGDVMGERAASSPQFCHEPETVFKNKVYFKRRKGDTKVNEITERNKLE